MVASRIAFLIGSDLYLYFAGYDPAWKSYSVMTVLMTEVFKWSLAHGVERVTCPPVATSPRCAGSRGRSCSVTPFRYRRPCGPGRHLELPGL